MSKTAIATRTGPSPALTRVKEELAKVTDRANALRKTYRESKVPRALMGTGCAVGAATVSGAIKGAYGDDEIAGINIDLGLGLLAIGLGVGMGNEWAIMAAAGPLAVYANERAKDMAADWMS